MTHLAPGHGLCLLGPSGKTMGGPLHALQDIFPLRLAGYLKTLRRRSQAGIKPGNFCIIYMARALVFSSTSSPCRTIPISVNLSEPSGSFINTGSHKNSWFLHTGSSSSGALSLSICTTNGTQNAFTLYASVYTRLHTSPRKHTAWALSHSHPNGPWNVSLVS